MNQLATRTVAVPSGNTMVLLYNVISYVTCSYYSNLTINYNNSYS